MDIPSLLVEVGFNLMSSGLLLYGVGRLVQFLDKQCYEIEEEEQLKEIINNMPPPQIIVLTPTDTTERKTVGFKGINEKEYNEFKETTRKKLQKRVEAHRQLDDQLDQEEYRKDKQTLQKEEEKVEEPIVPKPSTTTQQYIDLTGDDNSDTETQLLSQD